ncbi:GNAT family N-acetyltransferase [Paenibacillus campi]|uniref:GNAT family N-acetyltransferase n=1 Tax=Paenibacillus campi TaxID=3106031 RepID=UPI002AFE7D08|nr:GNAT family N-acetyltransferase [Paenibacillus sp. SGZ-1014]
MSDIKCKRIDVSTEQALQLPNEPFDSPGKLIVTRTNTGWQHKELLFASPERQQFPDEHYQLEAVNQAGFALGAFAGETCVGIAVFEKRWTPYLYLSDLKIAVTHRRQNIASKLLHAAVQIAQAQQLKGLSTVAQDNNLNANRFYLNYGFEIGGLNTKDYHFTNQRGKYDIYYYLDFSV